MENHQQSCCPAVEPCWTTGRKRTTAHHTTRGSDSCASLAVTALKLDWVNFNVFMFGLVLYGNMGVEIKNIFSIYEFYMHSLYIYNEAALEMNKLKFIKTTYNIDVFRMWVSG